MKKSLFVVLASVAVAFTSYAGEAIDTKAPQTLSTPIVEEDLFRAKELSVDVFGGYQSVSRTEAYGGDQDSGGGGLGINYFITKYIGVGAEASGWTLDGGAVSANANLLFRYPFEGKIGFAPYILLGGGGLFGDETVGEIHGGGGFEVRLNKNWGIYTDTRYIWSIDNGDLWSPRLGVRYAF